MNHKGVYRMSQDCCECGVGRNGEADEDGFDSHSCLEKLVEVIHIRFNGVIQASAIL